MYAIIETGGKQIRVEEGSTIFVEKLDVQEGEAVACERATSLTCNRFAFVLSVQLFYEDCGTLFYTDLFSACFNDCVHKSHLLLNNLRLAMQGDDFHT